jgi:hypothetical protein
MVRRIFQESIFIAVALMLFGFTASGQAADSLHKAKVKSKPRPCPKYYVGISGGMNNPPGYFGVLGEYAFTGQWSGVTGVGMSTWGPKVFLEGRRYFKPCNRGWAAAGGLTYSFGTQKLHIPSVNTIYGDQEVVINQHPQLNALLSAGYFFKLGRRGRNRFNVQLGYSFPLTGHPSYDSDIPLSPDGEKQIEFLAPGGIMAGIGFSFGFGAIHPK